MMSTGFSTRFDEALVYASELHRTQTRKGSGFPYVSHLLMVTAIVIENGGDEDTAIAALLHDAMEDQGGEATLAVIRQRWGDRVAEVVRECSDNEGEPKRAWIDRKRDFVSAIATLTPGRAWWRSPTSCTTCAASWRIIETRASRSGRGSTAGAMGRSGTTAPRWRRSAPTETKRWCRSYPW